MAFWQLTLPASADSSEERSPTSSGSRAPSAWSRRRPPASRRACAPSSPRACRPPRLLAAVQDYQASLRSLGFAIESQGTEITPLLDEAWASAWQQSFPAREVGRRLLVLPPWIEPPARADGRPA